MPLLRWNRKSEEVSEYEDQIFSCLKKEPERQYVQLDENEKRQVWTLKMNEKHHRPGTLPLVMLHGMGAGIGLWLKNIEELSIDRPLYAFDLPGFGRSYRAKHQSFKTAEEAEDYFVDAIESWRKAMQLQDFILLGHSFGGYLASAYTLKYPSHVKGMILVDAWGFSKKKIEDVQMPRRVKLGLTVYKTLSLNPLSFLRAAGSWGPSLITRYRPDIVRKYQHRDLNEGVIANYVYHCNALEPSGEIAFKCLVEEVGWPQRPMVDRIGDLYAHIPIAMVNGKDSWIDHTICDEVKRIRENSFVHVELVSKAGHHVYADQPDIFNNFVRSICSKFECPSKLLKDYLPEEVFGDEATLSEGSDDAGCFYSNDEDGDDGNDGGVLGVNGRLTEGTRDVLVERINVKNILDRPNDKKILDINIENKKMEM